MHVTARELHSCPEVCEVPLISKVYDKYPKSLQEALQALKSLENCPFLHGLPPNFIQGDLPGKVLKAARHCYVLHFEINQFRSDILIGMAAL